MKKHFTILAFLMLISIFSFAQKERASNTSLSENVFGYEQFIRSFFHGDDSPQPTSNRLMNTIKHRLDSIVFLYIDGSNDKQVLNYDSHGNCILSVEYIQDDYTDDWKNYYKTEYAFDIFGNLTSKINSRWRDEENRWGYSHKMKYVYDGQGLGLILYHYMWNNDLDAWEPRWKEKQSFNSQGDAHLILSFIWSEAAEEWNESQKTTFTYNDNELLTAQLNFNWMSDSNTWLMTNQHDYCYDSYNNLISILNIQWMNNISINQHKTEYLNDENGNMIESISYDWSTETNQWLEQIKNGFSFDELGNTTQFISSEWSSWDTVWMEEAKLNLVYNNDIPFDEVLWPFDEEDDMINLISMPISLSQQEITENNEWGDFMSGQLYYSEFEYDFIEEEKHEEIQLFPNPVSSQFSLHIPDSYQQVQFELYDLQGRLIMKKDVTNKESINIENLKPGVYIYSISFDNKTQRGKLINKQTL